MKPKKSSPRVFTANKPQWDPWSALNRWEALTQRAMTLWDRWNSYTSSSNGNPRANCTPTKALEIHPVQCFYREWEILQVKLHQLIAQIWWISMGPQRASLGTLQCTHPVQGLPLESWGRVVLGCRAAFREQVPAGLWLCAGRIQFVSP